MQSLSPEGLHVAIIMDGNGRWATQRGLPRIAGHRAGVASLRRVVEHAPTEDVFTRPGHEYTRQLLEAIPGSAR